MCCLSPSSWYDILMMDFSTWKAEIIKPSSSFSPSTSPSSSSEKMASSRCLGRRGRRPAKLDTRVRLERSQQSARECRARKKLRYQYLEELVSSREKAIYILRQELELYRKYCQDIDGGVMPKEVEQMTSASSENKWWTVSWSSLLWFFVKSCYFEHKCVFRWQSCPAMHIVLFTEKFLNFVLYRRFLKLFILFFWLLSVKLNFGRRCSQIKCMSIKRLIYKSMNI